MKKVLEKIIKGCYSKCLGVFKKKRETKLQQKQK